MYVIDALKAMYSDYQISPIVINWFKRTRELQLYVKKILKQLQNLPTESKTRQQIHERANENLVSISKPDEDLVSDEIVEHKSHTIIETNELYLKCLE